MRASSGGASSFWARRRWRLPRPCCARAEPVFGRGRALLRALVPAELPGAARGCRRSGCRRASASPSCGSCAAARIARRRISSISRKPRIVDYIKSNFEVLQLNILGSREVTDFDGEVLAGKGLGGKYDVRYTPTFQFFGEDAGTMKTLPPQAARGVAHCRLSAARRFPQPVPLCARQGLREADLARFSQGAAELSCCRLCTERRFPYDLRLIRIPGLSTMSKLNLSVAVGPYDRTRPLIDGACRSTASIRCS